MAALPVDPRGTVNGFLPWAYVLGLVHSPFRHGFIQVPTRNSLVCLDEITKIAASEEDALRLVEVRARE